MKTRNVLKIASGILACGFLMGCHEHREPLSHLTSGTYRCYYQDERTGRFFQAKGENEHDTMRAAKRICLNEPPKDYDHQFCHFMECIFK
ncbi:MAG: hypothetical protein ACD_29C00167G0001 [uncultured bacterium]|nr:MAG: hypothetical protein ACD_29C00167G0001 [uncultured bacterium]OGT33193.1 MAG: hypothetical protein A3C44_06390 [Gammaproteobacteria bacterium RIFCSPHIGHO2_02_FULL_39_13]OGT49224.1 MAG: hypothetical protein A3E53_07145 [Gammaproteobacteria bacterium RIFCSPHIGHO2_12_FULL_39_24]